MYLTAHRIESLHPPHDRAIHAHLYVHDGELELTEPRFDEMSTVDPGGTHVLSYTPEPPTLGGNAVLSFLDIAAADDVATETLDTALRVFAEQLATASLPHKWGDESVWVRFHISTIGYQRERAHAVDVEFQDLLVVAMAALEKWRGSAR